MGLLNFLFGSDDDVNKYKTNPAAGENAYFQWRPSLNLSLPYLVPSLMLFSKETASNHLSTTIKLNRLCF